MFLKSLYTVFIVLWHNMWIWKKTPTTLYLKGWTITSHSLLSDLETVRLFNLFMAEEMNSGCWNSAWGNISFSQKQHYVSSSKIKIGVKGEKSKEGLPIKEKAKKTSGAGWYQKECRMGCILKEIKTTAEDRGLLYAAYWCSVIMAHASDTQRP